MNRLGPIIVLDPPYRPRPKRTTLKVVVPILLAAAVLLVAL